MDRKVNHPQALKEIMKIMDTLELEYMEAEKQRPSEIYMEEA